MNYISHKKTNADSNLKYLNPMIGEVQREGFYHEITQCTSLDSLHKSVEANWPEFKQNDCKILSHTPPVLCEGKVPERRI